MSKTSSRFVWYDVMTDGGEAAESFYKDVIGWDAKDSGMPGGAYTIFSKGSTMIAGLMPVPAEARTMGSRPVWTGYIGVDNVDDYVQRVKAAGGSVHKAPQDIPSVGRFAVVADPFGAAFILFTPMGEQTAQVAPGEPGHIGWHELYAGDLERAFAFYSGLFGWSKAEAVDMGDMGIYQTFATGGAPVGGMMAKPPQMPAPGWLYYFNVDAADAAAERIKKGGGKIVHGPQQVPGGSWIVQAIDPQGAMFAVVGAKR